MPVPEELRRRVRHDLRGPLAVILGRAELLQSDVLGPLTEGQRRSVDAIMQSGERLQRELEAFADDLDRLVP